MAHLDPDLYDPHLALHRTFTDASNSNSTASDLDGLGRTVDNFISRCKAPVERLATRLIFMRMLRGSPAAPAVLTLPAGTYVYEDASDPNSTASDLDGPGRTIDNLISRAKKPLERIITNTAVRLGYGPAVPFRAILRSMNCKKCNAPSFGPIPLEMLPPLWRSASWMEPQVDIPAADAPAGVFAEWVISRSSARCRICKHFDAVSLGCNATKYGKVLSNMIRGDNISSRYTAVLYLAILALVIPRSSAFFTDIQAVHAVHQLSDHVLHRPTPDLDYLLAPSRRALINLDENAVHGLIQDIMVAKPILEAVPIFRNPNVGALLRKHDRNLRMLARWVSKPAYQCLVIWYLPSLWRNEGLFGTLMPFFGELKSCPIWVTLATTDDTVLRSVLTRLVVNIQDPPCDILHCLDEPQTGAKMFQKSHPELVKQLPPLAGRALKYITSESSPYDALRESMFRESMDEEENAEYVYGLTL